MDQSQQNKIEITHPNKKPQEMKPSQLDADKNLQNSDQTVTDKRLNRRAQRQKLAMAGFAQLQKTAFDCQFGAQDTDLMVKSLMQVIPQRERSCKAKENLQDVHMESTTKRAEDDYSNSPIKLGQYQNRESSNCQDDDLAAKFQFQQEQQDQEMKGLEEQEGVNEAGLEEQVNYESEEHKKDIDQSQKVYTNRGSMRKGSLNQPLSQQSQQISKTNSEDACTETQRQPSILNNQNSVIQKQLESIIGRQQKSPRCSQGHNISQLLKKVLENYQKDKNGKVMKKSVGNQSCSFDQNQSKTLADNSEESQMKVVNQQFEEFDQNFSQKNETEINNQINCEFISFNDSKQKNQVKQMRDANLEAKAQLLRQLSGQVALSAGQKLQDMGFDSSQKGNQFHQMLVQEILRSKNVHKDGSQQNLEKGTFKTALNGQTEVYKSNDCQDNSSQKDIQNSLSKLLGIQKQNTVHVLNNAKKAESQDINLVNIENRQLSNSNDNKNITEILAKLQNIQKQSNQYSFQNNRDLQQQQRTEAVNSLKNLKSILAEKSAAQHNFYQQNSNFLINNPSQIESSPLKKDTCGDKQLSANSIQQLNRCLLKKDIPANQTIDKQAQVEANQQSLHDIAVHGDVEMNIKGKNESDMSNLVCQTEPLKEEKLQQVDCEMSSEKVRKNSKVDSKSAAHLLELNENQVQKASLNEKQINYSANKKSEERAKEEISSLMNLIKTSINANPKYKNLSDEDNGALWSIMSKLEGSIGITQQNKNGNENDKDKISVPSHSQGRPSESRMSENKMTDGNQDHLMNSDEQQKQALNNVMKKQIQDSFQQQQLQCQDNSYQDNTHLQVPQNAQKGQNNKDQGATQTTEPYTESNQATLMSQTNGNVKGSSKAQPSNQPQASLNIGELTATAVTKQTTFDAIDPRIKKMQSGFLLNNSSPLGKFNAQGSQIVENNQNIFRAPQNQHQAVPGPATTCSNNQPEKYSQIKQILQILQTIDSKKDTVQGAHKDAHPDFEGAKREQEDKQVDSGIAAVARQASRDGKQELARMGISQPLPADIEQKLKQALSPQQISQIKSIPVIAQLLNLDSPEGQMSPPKTQQPMLQEPQSGSILKKLVLGGANDQLHRSLSLQSNDYLASLARSVSLAGDNSHNPGANSAVGGVNQGAPPATGVNNGSSTNVDGAAAAMNQQMLKAVRQFLVNQQTQQEQSGSRSVPYNQIQQLINTLTNEQQMSAQQENNNPLASLRRSLSSTSAAGLQGLLQTKPNELPGAQTPLNQLLNFQGGDKSAALLGQVKALGLDLSNTPVRAQDSFIIKDIDSPSKMRMRTFLDRQRSTAIGDFGKSPFESNAEAQARKESHLHNLLLGASPNRNNQELSLLNNMINDDDDRFGNIKMSDEEISPEHNNPGDGFLTGGPRLVVSHRSKGIKKDHGFAHIGHGGYAPHPTLALGHAHSYEPQAISEGLLRSSDEKIQDKGEYYLIHRMNTKTKRLNQILQCKLCPMKFPKLCNLRDHVRIHKEDMPFKCSLCGKAFTQAGNRDRHESKRVCLRRNNNQQGSPTKRADEAGSDSGIEKDSPLRVNSQDQPQSSQKVEDNQI